MLVVSKEEIYGNMKILVPSLLQTVYIDWTVVIPYIH